MAIAHVQTNGADNQLAPVNIAFASNVTAGNTLFCDISYEGTGPVTSVADTRGNTWLRVTLATGAGAFRLESWSTVTGTSGACTVTITTPTIRHGVTVCEYSGLGTGTLDQQNTHENTGIVTSHTCGSITTTQIGLIRAMIRLSSSFSVTSNPAGYNVRRANGVARSLVLYDKIASGTETTDPTLVTTGTLADHGMVYNVVGAGAAAVERVQTFLWGPI